MSNVCGGHGHTCCQEGYRGQEARTVVRDPVCGRKIDCESEGVRQLNWDDAVFYFCDTRCMTKFVNDPKKYMKPGLFAYLRRWL